MNCTTDISEMQTGFKGGINDKQYIEVKDKKRHMPREFYVVHAKHAYQKLEQRLEAVQAPQLSYRLFYFLASELHYPAGNIVSYDIKILAACFKLTASSIYAALAKLFIADVVRKHARQQLELHPYMVFAGKIPERDAARKKWTAETRSTDDPIYHDEPEDTTP